MIGQICYVSLEINAFSFENYIFLLIKIQNLGCIKFKIDKIQKLSILLFLIGNRNLRCVPICV